MMGLKIVLEWYDKRTAIGQGEEFSNDLGDDESVLNALGIPVENNINNGGFDVLGNWVDIIQPFFQHPIAIDIYDYQIAFEYSDNW
jgi:hypothetical protein